MRRGARAQIRIDGTVYPAATYRLQLMPVARLIISQLIGSTPPLLQLASPPGEPERVVTVEATAANGNLLFRCRGPVVDYQVFFDDSGGEVGDKEFVEIAYTELEYPTSPS